MSKNPNNISATLPDAYSGHLHVNSTGNGFFNQLTNGSVNTYDAYKTLSIPAAEKEYLETIALAADLLAGQVISPQDFFKLKLLLKSKDEEVRNTAIIFLNQKAKL